MTKVKPQSDTGKAHSARVYDYLLGGKDHYAVDAEVGKSLWPGAAAQARQNRAFMNRAVAWLAEEGVDQFLDIGTGIPTEPNLHRIVQEINPAARIVYADNDPIVLRHAEALLISTPEGGTDYIEADVRNPGVILEHARTFLDLSRPAALSMIGLLHFLPDHEDPHGIVRTLVDALAPGSYLVLSQGASDLTPAEMLEEGTAAYGSGGIQLAARTREEFGRFFDGLDLVQPGIVVAPQWVRNTPAVPANDIYLYAGVAKIR